MIELIKTIKVTKEYKVGNRVIEVLKGIDLRMYEGDFTVIMGASGSGKSTLLYLLCGLDTLTSGKIYIYGERADKFSEKKWSLYRRKYISFVHQSFNLVPNLTIRDNIIFPAMLLSKKTKNIKKRADNLMKNLGIYNIASNLPSQVSGGEQQRTAIAKALIKHPKILFADEPTGALNSANGEYVLDVLSHINSMGQSIVMVTHDLKAACRANRIIFLKDGYKKGSVLTYNKYEKGNEYIREGNIYRWLKDRGW